MKAALTSMALLVSSLAFAAAPDGSIDSLQASVQGKTIGTEGPGVQLPRPAADYRDTITQALAAPLSADAAVRVALLNNPQLQATLGAEGLTVTDGFGSNTPSRVRAQQAVTVLSAQAFKAWVNAVAARQNVQLMRNAKDTAESSNALVQRMVQAGNVNKLTQAHNQAALSEAVLALARAEQAAFAARETLTVVLGLSGMQTQFALPDLLPSVPAQALDLPDIEARALRARADLQSAQQQWLQKQSLALRNPEARWDAMGDAAGVRAQGVLLRSQARSAYYRYRSSWDIARHLQDAVLPLRKFIHDEQVLRYNGMLTSVFEVLADSQTQTLAHSTSAMAQRDFWLAHADLQALLAGAPFEAIGGDAGNSDAASSATSKPAGH